MSLLCSLMLIYMEFGDWRVNEFGIINNSNPYQVLKVSKESIGNISFRSGKQVYSCFIEITKADWIPVQQIEAFHVPFLFAMGKFSLKFDEDLFKISLAEQNGLISLRRINQMLIEKKLKAR